MLMITTSISILITILLGSPPDVSQAAKFTLDSQCKLRTDDGASGPNCVATKPTSTTGQRFYIQFSPVISVDGGSALPVLCNVLQGSKLSCSVSGETAFSTYQADFELLMIGPSNTGSGLDLYVSPIPVIAPSSTTSTSIRAPSSTTSSGSVATARTYPCPATNEVVSDASGALYTISCGIYYVGNDLVYVHADTFEGCMTACDNTGSCVGASWAPDPTTSNNCVLKNAMVSPSADLSFNSFQRVASLCPASDKKVYQDTSNDQYQIFCNQDLPGNDLGERVASSMADCLKQCSQLANCASITWVPSRTNNCYPKSGNQQSFITQPFECDSVVIIARGARVKARQADIGVPSAVNSDAAASSTADYDYPTIAAVPSSTPSSVPEALDPYNTTASGNSTNDGVAYINVTTSDNKYALTSAPDGSLFLSSLSSSSATLIPGTSFASYDGLVVSDYTDRLLHIYEPEIIAYGISRLRVAAFDHMPVSSQLVNLVPIDYDNNASTPSIYVVVDTLGGHYFLVLCNFEGQEDKMFAVRDPQKGVSVLESPDVRFTITGGVVKSCGLVALGGPGGVSASG